MKLQRFIQGVRLHCSKCKKEVTPFLMLDIDDKTGLLESIDCKCPDCGMLIRVLR